MALLPRIAITDSQLLVHGKALLSSVPKNVALTPVTGFASSSAFLGASSSESKSRHVFSLGVLKDWRFVCCFRFKLWWMTQRMGNCGKDVPLETQFLLMESKHGSILSPESDVEEEMVYTVFLPILEGPFRSSLQGNETDELEFCLESGDSAVCTSSGLHSIYLHAGTNPFEVIAEAVKEVEMNLKTFQHREKKKLPGILDWFGWCTWDAFYTDVTAQGIMEGLKSLESGGTPVRFVIIDDGWQSVGGDDQPQTDIEPGTEAPMRLINIKENYKFQKDGKDGERHDDPALGIQHVISEAKRIHNLKYVYVWHALTGYWGGVKPGVIGMEDYESTMKFPIPSPGVLGNSPDMETDHIVTFGHGLVHPKRVFEFYNELHSYLAASGVDGVKVDVQNIIETLGSGFGGRVSLARQYLEALEASIASKFPDNGCIACMSHNTDGLYNLKQIAVLRASDDFWPADPASHTIHIASVAYNSLFLGEFMQPDWDMFHSLHPAAEYHAAARAIGGCAVYVSDKPGHHDFELLKKLVLPDGSVLRACLPGRPTCDSLFNDPARDGKSLLKIWNMNKHTGVLGIFNCQGAGWCELRKVNAVHNSSPPTISGTVRASDVALLTQIAPPQGWTHECVLYSHRGGELRKLLESTILPITLQTMEYEVFTVVPVKVLAPGVSFAPLGLLKMFNTGGAITDLSYGADDEPQTMPSPSVSVVNITVTVHGCGQFGAYSSSRPSRCFVGSSLTDFSYNPANGLVSLSLPVLDDLYQMVSFEIRI